MTTDAPDQSPLPLALTSPPSGWWSSEHVVLLIALALSSVLSSNLITDDRWVKIITIALSMLGSLGYTAARTSLKVAHVRAGALPVNDNAATARTMSHRSVGVAIAATAMLMLLAITGCPGGTPAAVKAGGKTLSTCAKADIYQLLPALGIDLLTDVSNTLANNQTDYASQLDALASTVEKDAFDCAVKTATTVFSTAKTNAAGETPAVRGQNYMKARSIK